MRTEYLWYCEELALFAISYELDGTQNMDIEPIVPSAVESDCLLNKKFDLIGEL